MSKNEFARLVEEAVSDLPEPFAAFLEEVPIEILDRPTRRHLEEAGLEPGSLLLGLYLGHPRTERSVWDSGHMPDVIYIFQEPIESVTQSEQELIDQVRITVLHEIGHHFGMDEQDLEDVGFD